MESAVQRWVWRDVERIYGGEDLVCRGMKIIREWYRRSVSSTERSEGVCKGVWRGTEGWGGVRREYRDMEGC